MKPSPLRTYNCSDYREEMRLLGLKRRLEHGALSPEERARLRREIDDLERAMALG